jgi:hypothetical protein
MITEAKYLFIRSGSLPKTLDELGNPSPDNLYYLYDPWMNKIEYTVKEGGSFILRSIGPDQIPSSEDDIVSYE